MAACFDFCVTSASKMDAVFLPEESREVLKDVFEMLEPEVGDVLWLMCRMDRKGFEDELCSKFDVKAMKEIRIKIFRAALDKVDLCLSQVARARTINSGSPCVDYENVHKADNLLRVLTPQDMINRRCTKKLVADISDLLVFIAHEKSEFPVGMIKGATADIPLGRDFKNAIECIQMIVTTDTGTDEHTDDNQMDEECEDETPVGTNTPPESDVQDGAISDDVFEDKQISEQSHICDDIYESNLELCRTLLGNDEEVSPVDAYQANEVDESHDNLCDEISRAENNIIRYDPICPLVVVSETSPIPRTHDPQFESYANVDSPMVRTPLVPDPGSAALHNNDDSETSESHWSATSHTQEIDPVARHSAKPRPAAQPTHASTHPERKARKTVIETLPATDKATSTADLWEHIIAEREYPDVNCNPYSLYPIYDPTMSGFDNHNSWAMKRRAQPKKDDSCKECGKKFEEVNVWRDSVSRRVNNVEDTCSENMEKMRNMRDEVKEELRVALRRMDIMDGTREVFVSDLRHAYTDARGATGGTTTEAVNDGPPRRGRPTQRREKEQLDPDEHRRRAVSFSGPIRSNSNQGRARQAANPPDATLARRPDPPKEQRTRLRPDGSRSDRQSENPIKDWLSSAKQQKSKTPIHQEPPTRDIVVLKSPSWADDCATDDDDAISSNDPSTSSPSVLDIDREGTPEHHANESNDEIDDVYLLPPSGQVSSARAARCDADADAMYALPPPNGAAASGSGRNQNQRRGNDNSKQKDKRPKTKGNTVPDSRNVNGQSKSDNPVPSKNVPKPKVKPNTGKKGMSYAKAVADSDWKIMQNKKRKFEKVSPRNKFPLKGSVSNTVRDVYLQGLAIEDGQNNEDVIESVREYCNKHGITPVFIRIIPVKYDCTRTGVRLTIKSEDFERVMRDTFWPEHITVRQWTPRNRDRRQNDNGDGHEVSDDDN